MGSKWLITYYEDREIILTFDTEEKAQEKYDELAQMYWRLYGESKLKHDVNICMSRVFRSCELTANDPIPNW